MGQLDGKTAIVTGGGTGIGKAIARAFAKEGAALVIASRNRENLDYAAEQMRSMGAVVEVIPTDVTDEAQVAALFEATMERSGRLDIMVNNSGTGDYVSLADMSLERWNRVLAVNLTGVFLGTREALKIMKLQGGGRIINIGSISAKKPRMDQGAYSASKAGVLSLTVSAAMEGREYGIAASCLHPGLVDVSSELRDSSKADTPDEPAIVPDDIAAAALSMATLPPDVNLLEALVMPSRQLFLGRG